MPPHIVSMDSNLLMNSYRDPGMWQRSGIIPRHAASTARPRWTVLPLCGSELNAPWSAKRGKSLVPNVLENQEFGPEIKKTDISEFEFLSPQPGSGSNSEMSLGALTWRRKLEGIKFGHSHCAKNPS